MAKKQGWKRPHRRKKSKIPPDSIVLNLLDGKCLRATRERPEWVERHLKRLTEDQDLQRRLVDRLMSFEEDEMSLLYWMLEDKYTQEQFLTLLCGCIDFQTRASAPQPHHDHVRYKWQ